MTPKHEPGLPVLVEIGDRLLELRYSLRTLKEMHRVENLNVFAGLKDALADPNTMAVLLYYGLKEKQPDITQEWVEDNVTAAMLVGFAPYLALATTGQAPEAATQRPNGTRSRRTGSPSGPSEDTISVSQSAISGT